jgi:ABC-type multidrug transport system fused ATPase/permease subunit
MYITKLWIDFLKNNIALCLTSAILVLSIPVNDIALPHFYSNFIDSLQKNNFDSAKKVAIIIIGLLIFVQFLSIYGDLFDAKFTPKFQGHISLEMVRKILDKHDETYSDLSTGSLLARFAKIPELFQWWLSNFKNYLVPYAITFFGIFVYFTYYDRVIGISFLVCMSIIIFITSHALGQCQHIAAESAAAESNLFNQIEDTLNNLFSIYSNNKKGEEIERLQKIRENFEKQYVRTVHCGTKYKTISFVFLTIFFVIFIYRCIDLIKNKKMDNARIVAMFMMFTTVFGSIVWCIGITRDIIKDYSVISETDGFTATPNIETNPIPSGPTPYSSGIGLNNVDFTYPNTERQILYNISFQINRGERVAIVGDNGMGKSTVMKILMGFYRPTKGAAYIDGKWYDNYSKDELRKKIAYIPQNSVLFNRSLMENIRYGNENYTEQQILDFIHSLNLKNELGDLNRLAGKAGNNLSGGQRQLIWMIRVLLKNSEYIILDEPTNNLDITTKKLLLSLLDKVKPEQTVIAISHDPIFTDYFKRKIVIDKGKVVN